MTRVFSIILSILLTFAYHTLHAQSCNVPSGIQARATSSQSAQIKWSSTATPPSATFQLEIIKAGQNFTGLPDSTMVSMDSLHVVGLEASTEYRFKIRTQCSANEFSPWSASSTFRTHLTNPSHCGMNLLVGDLSCDTAANHFPIDVVQAPGMALGQDVQLRAVRVILEHDWLIDLALYLRAPDGTRIKLVDSIGSGSDNFGNVNAVNCGEYTEFSAFCTSIPIADPQNAVPPYIGTFLPKQNLTAFNTGADPNGTWVLEVCDDKANNIGRLQYVELVFSAENCAPPEHITQTDVFADGLSVEWDTVGVQADSVFIEIGPTGFRPAHGKALLGDTLIAFPYPLTFPISVSGLPTFTDLTAFIRYECNGIVGANSCAIPFFTRCENPNIEEHFDTQSLCAASCGQACVLQSHWENVSEDDVDWFVRSGSTPSGGTGPSDDFEGGGNYIYVEASGVCALQKTAELRSQCIAINAQPNACNLTFAYHMFGSAIGSLRLEISTDGGLTWDLLFQRSGAQGAEWQQQNIDLSLYNGLTAVFRFIGKTGGGTAGDMALDNIRFFGSTLAGQPSIFYADSDGDGFGDSENPKGFCLSEPPAGFVADSTDCNDSDASIFPDATEILCNDIDENCNGMVDDRFIPVPQVATDSTCAGEAISLNASGAKGQFYWYDAPTNGQLLNVGNTLTINSLNDNTSVYVIDSVSASAGACASDYMEVPLKAMPVPSLSLSAALGKSCVNEIFDLDAITVFDSVQSTAFTQWYDVNYLPLSTNQVSVSQAGNQVYNFVGTSAFGCADTVAYEQTIFSNPTASILQGDSISTCIGSTVVLNGQAAGGAAPYTYAWSTGLNFANIPVNAAATGGTVQPYDIYVRDANGCMDTANVKIYTLSSITDTRIEAVNDVTSCGGTDGSIHLRPLDGQGPYSFAWNGPTSGTLTNISEDGLITGLPQGAYRITVTDNSSVAGCGMILPLIIISAPGLSVQLDTVIHASCFGTSDGSVALEVNGIAPTYLWSDGSTNKDLSQVPANPYSVTVTDGSCTLSLDDIDIQQPTEIFASINQLDSVACHGDSTGLVELFTQGGTAPYDLEWSNGAQGDSIAQLAAGSYAVTITDATQCSTTDIFVVSEPLPLNINTLSATDSVDCFGDATGEIRTTVSGGTGAYSYAWSTAALAPSISGLTADSYTLTVSDANACTSSFFHEIKSPDSLYIAAAMPENPTCKGRSDGLLSVIMEGGTYPYTYTWDNGDNTALITGLGEGTYASTITDDKGCNIATPSYTLVAEQVLEPTILTIEHVACFGDATGKIALTTEGGTAPYTYLWNDVLGQDSLTELSTGAYTPQIVDANGCTILMDSIQVEQPAAPLEAAFSSVEMPICFGQATGSIAANAEGGTAPYVYFWNGNNQGPDVSALIEGSYELRVVDAALCSDTISVFLRNPAPIMAQAMQSDTIPCFGASFGALCLNATGGTGLLDVQWSNGLRGDCQTSLLPGNYTATVTDALGCEATFEDQSVVSEDDLFEIEHLEVRNNACAGDSLASIFICLPTTQAPYQFSWNAPIGLHTNTAPCDTVLDITPGRYRLKVTDGRGCTAVLDTVVAEPAALRLSIPTSMAIEPICFGDSTGSLTAMGVGGQPPYAYAWNNGMEEASIDNLPQGCYRCTITDMNACTATTPDFYCLSTPAALEVDLSAAGIQHDECSNGQGAISILPSGGVPGSNPDYFYDWSNGFDSRNPTNLFAGNYTLTLTDHVGCTAEVGPYVVLPDPNPLITADSTVRIQNVACLNDSSGRIEIIPSGGTPSYFMSWSEPNLSGFVVENLPAGLYTATITDADFCTATYSVLISQPAEALMATASFTHANAGQPNGTASVDISGGAGEYTVQWDAATNLQTGPTAFNLPVGYYCATITDSLGCTIERCVDVLTSTALPEAITVLSLAPNPAATSSTLYMDLEQPTAARYTLLDVQGRIIYQKNSEKVQRHVWDIDVAALPSGLFFIKIVLESGATVLRPLLVQEN